MSPKIKFLAHRIASIWGFKITELTCDRIVFKNEINTYEIHKFRDMWLCVRFNDQKLGWESHDNGEYVFSHTLKGLLRDGLKTYSSPFEAWTAMGLLN